MINEILAIFTHSFMLRALIIGTLISLSSSLIGSTLVLKRNSTIGDGLSHVAFGAFAVATVLNLSPLEFSLPIVIIVSIFLLKLNEYSKIHGDSAIALIATSALALGTFVISIKSGVNTDINSYLFGSILSIGNKELIATIILTVFVIILFICSYNKIFALTFDERYAKSIGIKTGFYNTIIAIICSIVVVLGMRLVGSLLISSLIVFPTLSAMQVSNKFKSVVIYSVIISTLAFILGLVLSYFLNTPTGSTVVLVNLGLFVLLKTASLIKKD